MPLKEKDKISTIDNYVLKRRMSFLLEFVMHLKENNKLSARVTCVLKTIFCAGYFCTSQESAIRASVSQKPLHERFSHRDMTIMGQGVFYGSQFSRNMYCKPKLHRSINPFTTNRMNSSFSSYHSGAKQLAWQGIEAILSPKRQRRPLPSLLYKSLSRRSCRVLATWGIIRFAHKETNIFVARFSRNLWNCIILNYNIF